MDSTTPQTNNAISLTVIDGELLVDSRLVAERMEVPHKNLLTAIDEYADYLKRFGENILTQESNKRVPPFVLLNRGQAEFLLALVGNSLELVKFKRDLILAFEQQSEKLDANNEYLLFYHAAHGNLQLLLDKSENKTASYIHHMSIDKLINKSLGIQSGERRNLSPQLRLVATIMLAIVSRVCEQAIKDGSGHKEVYFQVKKQLSAIVDSIDQTQLLSH